MQPQVALRGRVMNSLRSYFKIMLARFARKFFESVLRVGPIHPFQSLKKRALELDAHF